VQTTPEEQRVAQLLVAAGAVFKNGKLIERPDESEGGDLQGRVTRRSTGFD
jgi:hypothetical protein